MTRLFFFVPALICTFLSFGQMKKNIEYSGFFDSYYWRGPWSIIADVGTSFYNGDLCDSPECWEYKISYGGGIAYKVWPRVQFGLEYTYLNLSSHDIRPLRNYSFSSTSHEFSLFGKFYIVEDIVRRHQDIFKQPKLVKPYIKIGIGTLITDAEITDSLGQVPDDAGSPENPSLIIPAAIGLQFDFSKRFAIMIEFDARYCFSDYIDGYSSEYSNFTDLYGGVFLKLQYSPFAPRVRKKKIRLSPPSDDSSPSSGEGSSGSGSNSASDSEKSSTQLENGNNNNSNNESQENVEDEEEIKEDDTTEEEYYFEDDSEDTDQSEEYEYEDNTETEYNWGD